MMLPCFLLRGNDLDETCSGGPPPRFTAKNEPAKLGIGREGGAAPQPRSRAHYFKRSLRKLSEAVTDWDVRRESPRAGECRWALSCGP